ncbi:MAG: response regulator [Candidatus Margulisiibacteriota bacterium]
MEKKKILVVDDDKNIVELLRVNLIDAGYEVIAAFDGYQAVNAAHKQKPDLIVLDIMLPAGGGTTVMDRLRISSDTAVIPVIAISALPKDQAKEKLSSYHVNEFFSKPLDVPALVKAINESLQK